MCFDLSKNYVLQLPVILQHSIRYLVFSCSQLAHRHIGSSLPIIVFATHLSFSRMGVRLRAVADAPQGTPLQGLSLQLR